MFLFFIGINIEKLHSYKEVDRTERGIISVAVNSYCSLKMILNDPSTNIFNFVESKELETT